MRVFRIQDATGRGPYRPGVSDRWKDVGHDKRNLPFYIETNPELMLRRKIGENWACAFKDVDQASQWFTADECLRMEALGYRFVRLKADRVILDTPTQLVVARRLPFYEGATILPMLHLGR